MKRRAPATREELQKAVNTFAFSRNLIEAAETLHMSHQTLQGWIRRAEQLGIQAGDVQNTPEWLQEKVGLQDQVRDLKAQIAASRRENLTAAVVREHILKLAAETPEPPKWLVRPLAKGDRAGVPCVMWSDWHFGEVIEKAQVNGINEYDMEIAQKRARRLVERTIDLCKAHMVGANYPGIVVNLGGDMCSGDIHEELLETNEIPTMPVLLELFGILIWAITKLADEFGRVFLPCAVGNHGRNTVKPRYKSFVYSNFDWLLYCFLEKHFASDQRVKFQIPSGGDAFYTVAGHRFLLTHGDMLGVRGGDGIIGSLGPILRGEVKIRNASSSIGLAYDTLVIGHWHQFLPLRRVIVNGCLCGYNEYAKLALRAMPEPPQQALWFVHPKFGITCHWPIYVDEPQKVVDTKWVSWAEDPT